MNRLPSPTPSLGLATTLLPWAVGLLTAVAMLWLFIDTLHVSVQRGEALRRAQGYSDGRIAMTRQPAEPAVLTTTRVADSSSP